MLDQLDSFSESEVVSETPASASHMGREDPPLFSKLGSPFLARATPAWRVDETTLFKQDALLKNFERLS